MDDSSVGIPALSLCRGVRESLGLALGVAGAAGVVEAAAEVPRSWDVQPPASPRTTTRAASRAGRDIMVGLLSEREESRCS